MIIYPMQCLIGAGPANIWLPSALCVDGLGTHGFNQLWIQMLSARACHRHRELAFVRPLA